MQIKIGRWEALYPRIQSAAKHIRCGFVCGYRKIAGPPLTRVYTVLTQARTGPPRRSGSNESMEHIVASGPCLIVNLSAERWSARVHADGSVDGPSNFKAQG